MRAVIHFLTRTRFLIFVLVSAIIVLSWRGLSGTAAEVQRYESLHHAAIGSASASKLHRTRRGGLVLGDTVLMIVYEQDSTVGVPQNHQWR